MTTPRYIRNFTGTRRIQAGTPLRGVFLDNPNDLIVKEFYDHRIRFENDERIIVIRNELRDLGANIRFPVRDGEDTGPIVWNITPLISDLAAGDTLEYLGSSIVVHDVYRRPGEDWARLTIKEPNDSGQGTSISRVWCMLDDKADFNTVFEGTRSWDEFPLETAGPYQEKRTGEIVYFYISPLGRGYAWRVGLPVTGPKRVTPNQTDLKRDYVFVGDYVSQRHPNDGNVQHRKLD